MKEIVLFLLLLCTFITSLFFINYNNGYNNETKYDGDEEIFEVEEQDMLCLFDRWAGGCGLANQNISGYMSGVGGGGGGAALIIFGYYLSTQLNDYINSLFIKYNNDNYEVNHSITIDDVLSEPKIKDSMEKYGWSRALIIEWLEKMLGVSISKFLTDENIKVYLGSTHSELKYNIYIEI